MNLFTTLEYIFDFKALLPNIALLIVAIVITLVILLIVANNKKMTPKKYKKITLKYIPLTFVGITLLCGVLIHIFCFVLQDAYGHVIIKTEHNIKHNSSELYSQVDTFDEENAYVIYNNRDNITLNSGSLVAFKGNSTEEIHNIINEGIQYEHYWKDYLIETKDFTEYDGVDVLYENLHNDDLENHRKGLLKAVKVYDLTSYVGYTDPAWMLIALFEVIVMFFIFKVMVVFIVVNLIISFILKKLIIDKKEEIENAGTQERITES